MRKFAIYQSTDPRLPTGYPIIEADYVEHKNGAIHFYTIDFLTDASWPVAVFVAEPNTLVKEVKENENF